MAVSRVAVGQIDSEVQVFRTDFGWRREDIVALVSIDAPSSWLMLLLELFPEPLGYHLEGSSLACDDSSFVAFLERAQSGICPYQAFRYIGFGFSEHGGEFESVRDGLTTKVIIGDDIRNLGKRG